MYQCQRPGSVLIAQGAANLSFATEPIHGFKFTLRHSRALNTNAEADELC